MAPPEVSLPPATRSMTLLAAAVLVHDLAAERVVLLQRGPKAKFAPGHWDLPVGKSDPGEPVTVTAVRELREETNLVVDPADLRLAHVVHGAHGVESSNGFVTVIFTTHRWSGTLRNLEPEKHSRAEWVAVAAIPEPLVFGEERVIHRCLAGVPDITLPGWA
ncbi:NUDIX domain-containing protein [Streptomyces hainanensis]|uniref:NUDIX domain-containing protein n=1 Tax=Streptomyces hainanensis TaxID=402648 RepID=A0A4R4TN62_9ACTN|nr:NUDIX domain-containing protein [Streptomyces hainanensis]TDC77314.1 NUDIX domain-containing protein [Streptomyces hainanensis]